MTEQHDKLRKTGWTNCQFWMPDALYRAFKAKLATEGRTAKEVLNRFVERYSGYVEPKEEGNALPEKE